MLSDLEIKHLLENAFLPDRCICNLDPYGSVSVQIYGYGTQELLLTVAGISRIEVASTRSVANTVGQIREEIRLREIVGERNTGTGQR
ncbi:DUF1652 domain-containing protein [Pseudomonas sp. NPDC088368]|uniref:DUF1652 domain-containing protein n=1 Tax=Pseudomonas sp. NPDC088368 TaxID=3364453 RepID=UPI0038005F0E